MHRFAALLLLAGLLTACSSPATTPSATSPAPNPTPTATDTAPDDSAEASRANFDAAVEPLETDGGLPKGSAIIDALESAGFDAADMELTADKTAIGLDADSIEFSVKFGDECVIGQFGSFGYRSVVMDVLATDTCLVGKTKEIAG